MISVSEQVLDLEFLAAYSGRFIPVYFSKLRRAIGQSDGVVSTRVVRVR